MIDKKLYDMPHGTDMAWCPGCGNFPILNIMKGVLAEMDILPTEVVICSGIGQAAKTPHYLRVHYFNGLHGRALPPAIDPEAERAVDRAKQLFQADVIGSAELQRRESELS